MYDWVASVTSPLLRTWDINIPIAQCLLLVRRSRIVLGRSQFDYVKQLGGPARIGLHRGFESHCRHAFPSNTTHARLHTSPMRTHSP